jgi:hypothetical protein
MRQILFKAQRADGIGLVEWYYRCINVVQGKKHLISDWFGNDIEVIPETVCQYTGLNDKNGKRIFENDTHLDEENDLFKVIQMECGRYALKMISNNYVCEFIDWDKIEIHGNVHDKNEE